MSRGMKMMVIGFAIIVIGAGLTLLAKSVSDTTQTASHTLEKN